MTDNDKETRARALASYLLDDGGDTWPPEDIFEFLEADGWTWTGQHWVEVDHAPAA